MMKKITNRKNFWGLEGFLNLLLFGQITIPELVDNKYYPLYAEVTELFLDEGNNNVKNNVLGMKILERVLTKITLEKECRKLRRELVKCYNNSAVDYLIDYLILAQKRSYSDNDLIINIDSIDMMRCYSSHALIPMQLKAYLSNHFVDLFDNFNVRQNRISFIKYERLLEKYLVHNTLNKIRYNIERHEKIKL